MSRDARDLGFLIEIVNDVASKTASRTATRHDLAVGKAALEFLVATADWVEAHLAGELSERHVAAIAWVRRICARYEAMLWQPTPDFLRS